MHLLLLVGVANVTCHGGSNGSIDVTVSGGTSPYSYSWNTGGTTSSLNNLTAGTYRVTVTDANACTQSLSVSVTQPGATLAATGGSSNITCHGVNDGAIDVTVSGGTIPYTYAWSRNPQAGFTDPGTQDLSALALGTYTLNVTDNKSCSATLTFSLTEPEALTVSVGSVTNVSCFGGNDGALTVSVSGGTTPHSYLWNTGGTTSTLNNLTAGTYRVTVTDANACTQSLSVIITQPGATLAATATGGVTNVTCRGGSDGSIDVTVLGGTPPYSYLWNTGGTTSSLSGLTAGAYRVTVKDANTCTQSLSVSITQPGVLVATVGATSVTTCGASDGSISVSISGGTSPYSYLWNTGGTTSSLSNLSEGTYQLTVTDAAGCTQSLPVSINVLSATGGATDITCHGANDGSIDLTISGGTPGYTYAWNNGLSAGTSHSNLSAGIYRLSVTDGNQCEEFFSYTITDPDVLTVSAGSVTNVSCFGGNDGALTVNVLGGTSSYSYLWNTGGTTSTLNNLTAGTYRVTVTDANACTQSLSVIITQPGAAVTAPWTEDFEGPTFALFNTFDPCWTTIPASSNSAYSWWLETDNTSTSKTGPSADHTTGIPGAGKYIYTEANWGSTGDMAEIRTPLIDISGITNPTLRFWKHFYGGHIDSFFVEVDTGNGFQTIYATHGPGPQTDETNPWVEEEVDLNAFAGSTALQIRFRAIHPGGGIIFDHGDLALDDISVVSLPCLKPNAISVVSAGITDVTLDWVPGSGTSWEVGYGAPWFHPDSAVGSANGPIGIVSANTHPFTVTGLTTGTDYHFYVREACATVPGVKSEWRGPVGTRTNCAAVPAPWAEDFEGSTFALYNIFDPCWTTIPASGFVYSWWLGAGYTPSVSTGPSADHTTGTGTGKYIYSETSWSLSGSQAEIRTPLIDISGITNPTLRFWKHFYGTDIRSFFVEVDTGSGFQTIYETHGPGPQTASTDPWVEEIFSLNAFSGSTALQIRFRSISSGGSLGDLALDDISVDPCLNIHTAVTNVTTCGVSDGSISVSISGGTPPYSYLWNTGATTSSLSNLSEGTYQLTVTDDGCTQSLSVNINALSATGGATDITCHGANDGSIDVTVSGGTTPYTYAWDNGLSAGTSHSNLSAGIYRLSVTDSNQCEEFFSYTLTEPEALTVSAGSVTNVSCFGGNDGALTVSVSGGTTPHSYLWNTGGTTSSLSGLTAGTYRVTVTDADACTQSLSVNITQPGVLVATVGTTNVTTCGVSDGSISVSISGGTAPYSYLWNTGGTTSSLSGLTTGTYRATVTDANACTQSPSREHQCPERYRWGNECYLSWGERRVY